MGRKKSKFQNPQSANITFSSTPTNPPISSTIKEYQKDYKRKVDTMHWQKKMRTLNGGEGALT